MRKLSLLCLFALTACAQPQPVATAPSPPSVSPSPVVIAPPPSATPSQAPSPKPTEPAAKPSSAGSPASPPTDQADASSPAQPEQAATLTSKDPGAQINVRAQASARSSQRHYGYAGDPVVVMGTTQNDEGETWHQVKFVRSGATGWVRSDFVALSTAAETPAVSPAPTPAVGTPLRSPVSGSCECPYDTDSRGRRCGDRSAYSRPGGAAPACYVGG